MLHFHLSNSPYLQTVLDLNWNFYLILFSTLHKFILSHLFLYLNVNLFQIQHQILKVVKNSFSILPSWLESILLHINKSLELSIYFHRPFWFLLLFFNLAWVLLFGGRCFGVFENAIGVDSTLMAEGILPRDRFVRRKQKARDLFQIAR